MSLGSFSPRAKTSAFPPRLSFFLLLLFCFFGDRVSLCSPGYPGTDFVDQAGLELPAVLGLKA